MFAKNRIGLVILVVSFVMSVICFLQLNAYHWTIYPAVVFSLMFVFQLFTIIRNSDLDISLKKDIYTLTGLLIVIVVSNVLWVFVFQWFRYIASISSLVFIYVLFVKLRNGVGNKLTK
jgi:hypothetical protein